MKRRWTVLGLAFILSTGAGAEYFDTDYIQDLRFRLLIAFFQEYRTFDLGIIPAQAETPGDHKAQLSSPAIGLSGFLIQYNNASVYLAGSFTEKDNPIANPDAKALKFILQRDAFSSSFDYLTHHGFGERNADNSFDHLRESMAVTWITAQTSYYHNHRRFAYGMPYCFGLRQKKSKFSVAGNVRFHYLNLNNHQEPLLRDKTINSSHREEHRIRDIGGGTSLTPALHLAAFEKLFLYLEVSAGFDFGVTRGYFRERASSNVYITPVIPQAKLIAGFNADRFIVSAYYSFMSRILYTKSTRVDVVYHSIGGIVGFRANIFRNLPWEND